MAKPYVIQNLNANGGVVSAQQVGSYTDPDAVSYVEQTGRTDAEKETARENIGLNGTVSAADVASAIGDMSAAQASQALEDLGGAPASTTDTDTTSTSITLASAADNTEYSYGELSALTITAIANPGAFSITFTSGATPTVLTVPQTMIMPDDFTVAANTRYEINVLDGYALVAGWAVSA